MYFNVANRIIVRQNRHFEKMVGVRDDGADGSLAEGEKIIFGVKAAGVGKGYLIRKELTNEDYDSNAQGFLLVLSDNDTNLRPGVYYYDIARQRADGELEVIGEEAEFIVKPSAVLA